MAQKQITKIKEISDALEQPRLAATLTKPVATKSLLTQDYLNNQAYLAENRALDARK